MPRHTAAAQIAAAPPPGLVAVDGKTFPLRSAGIAARAEGGVAATTLTQTYTNPYAEPLETLYTLPLPADGAVVGYAITIGERVIRGEVQPRERARELYRKALYEGHTAGLLEEERADTFTQRLGSVPPGATVEVRIEVLQPLGFVTGLEAGPRWEYRFPTVAGVRYEGAPGRVRDAEALEADRAAGGGTPVRLSCELIVAGGPAGSVAPASASHEIVVEEIEGGARVRLAGQARLDRDLVIRWGAATAEAGARLAEGPGLPGDDGRYGLLTITPPAAVDVSCPRDVTLLLDASGSMSGEPIRRAKAVAERVLRSLDERDRFEILVFSSVTRRLQREPVHAAPKEVERAVGSLRAIEAGGATEMTSAMIEALRPLRKDSQRQVILLSDGYIGFEAEVIGEVGRRLVPGARLHTVAVGSAPNRSLTHAAARAGRGVEVFVGDDAAIGEAAARLLRATVRPVLTEVEVGGSALKASAPARPRDVLEGQPLILAVELAREGGTLEVRARQAGSDAPWVRTIAVPALPASSDVVRPDAAASVAPGAPGTAAASPTSVTGDPGGATGPARIPAGALHGRELIADLDLRLAAGEPAERIDAQVERLGMRHRIASRRTSLVAISEEPDVDPRAPRRRERLPVDLPAELSAEGVGLGMAGEACRELRLASAPILANRPGMLQQEMIVRGVSRAWSRTLGRSTRGDTSSGPNPFEMLGEARILKRDGDLLVLEMEVLADGLVFPQGSEKIVAVLNGGERLEVIIDSELSSPQGPHASGTWIRVALRVPDGQPWTDTPSMLTGAVLLGHTSTHMVVPVRAEEPGRNPESAG